eukprot:3901844-Prymnesium_polylepis.2
MAVEAHEEAGVPHRFSEPRASHLWRARRVRLFDVAVAFDVHVFLLLVRHVATHRHCRARVPRVM